jgi:hypothetical protein
MNSFRIYCLLISCCACNGSFAQKSKPVNQRITSGKFYYYSQMTGRDYLIIRKNDIQMEIDLKCHDTSYWKMQWHSKTLLALTFIHSSKKLSEEELQFYETGKVYIRIANVTKNYYTFKGGIDSTIRQAFISDTMWFKPKKSARK